MAKQCLVLTVEDEATDQNLAKVEHYYGIEFERGTSNQGGNNGYHKMIGDPTLLKEMRFHNQMKIASVNKATLGTILNQTNWRKTDGGDTSVLDGSDGSDIIQQHTKDVYAILGGTNSVYERYIVSDQPFSYDGDEAIYLGRPGETPDYSVILDGKQRSIRNDSVNGTHGAGNGTGFSTTDYGTTAAGGYPTTWQNRFQFEALARAKNDDPSSNLPYANICNFDIELTAALMFIEFRTKNLNNILGHGISSVAAPTADNWGKVTGFRLTADGGQTYNYLTFGSQIWLSGATGGQNMWTTLNGSCPVLKMFEPQLNISDGGTLEPVKDADGNLVQGLSDGVMTGIWTKRFSFQLTCALTSGGEQKTYTVEAVIRVPVWRGRTRLWGNCTQWYSGYELLHYKASDGFHYKLFRAPSVEALTTDSDVTYKTFEGQFAFEKTYDEVGEMPVLTTPDGGAWAKNMLRINGISTAIVADTGGGLGTFENAFAWMGNGANTPDGQYIRRGSRFGGNAAEGSAVLRYATVINEPSNARALIGSGFHVQLAA